MADSTSFIILGEFTQTRVTMTELDTNSDGIVDSIRFDVEVVPVGSEDVIGDLRYLNFSVDEALLAGLTFESLDGGDSHNFRKSANGIDDIPGMASGFDIGIEFGDDGLKGGNDDIQTASFILHSTGELDLSDFFDFAIRLTSVGPEGGDRSGSDHGDTILQADVELVKTTEGLDDECPEIIAGEAVHWQYAVTNTGTTGLTNVVVTDDAGTPGDDTDDFTADAVLGVDEVHNIGDLNNDGILDVGETWQFVAEGPAIDGDYDNIATVEGDYTAGQVSGTVSDSEDDCYEGVTPEITIVKETNGTDNVCPQVIMGSTVTWTYTVTNTGEVDELANVVVVDDNGTAGTGDDFMPTLTGGDDDNDGLLDFGEIWTYSATGTATEDEYENVATVTADASDEVGNTTQVTDQEADCYDGITPAISILKETNGTNDVCPQVLAGSTVTWTYEVTNTGEVDELATIVVVDDNGTAGTGDDFTPTFTGGDDDNDGLLDFGETWTYTASDTAIDGEYDNIATASGVASDGSGFTVPVNDSDSDCYEGVTPAIAILKETNGTDDECPTVAVGSTVTWTYEVTNTGEVDELSNIVVMDDNGTADTGDDFVPTFTGGDDDNDGLLDFGEVWTYTASDTAVAGEYVNVATVTGTASDAFQNTAPVTASEDDCYFGLEGPGVRTPGFWQSRFGLEFWDGELGNETKGGQEGFPDGELLEEGATGLLIGDFNGNGVEDSDEDTIFISLEMARRLVDNDKTPHDQRWVLGRDMVASWLNFLADNPVGDDEEVGTPAYYIDAGVDWMLEYADSNGDGTFDLGGSAIRASSAAWQSGGSGLLAGRTIHNALDSYNNDGSINGVTFASDADELAFTAAIHTSGSSADMYMM